ncbi:MULTISPECIES: hypothetical protein [unclassified Bradyrhizobium]|uniref:hypothetical protein n=1 Tax=unclassified Bradyrhizobium TaxID=2631580 RepID=UPI001FF8006B|nr:MULTISPECIES: hypothetical protein [unclassified Bradyrhizobium]MCK1715287.1 hypothetical protein [Bradyrhizobium sp. 143]MCK1727157.1 hypothetical protein [Bradyrhizobium sp. 142]
MRKLILIAATSLLATHAYAGGPRSLSLAASNSSQQAPEQPATVTGTPQTTQAPSANVQTATTTSTSTPPVAAADPTTTPAAAAPAQSTSAPVANTTETTKQKRRQPSTEARVIRELHRHGIYW